MHVYFDVHVTYHQSMTPPTHSQVGTVLSLEIPAGITRHQCYKVLHVRNFCSFAIFRLIKYFAILNRVSYRILLGGYGGVLGSEVASAEFWAPQNAKNWPQINY